jgi:hypothetical protein
MATAHALPTRAEQVEQTGLAAPICLFQTRPKPDELTDEEREIRDEQDDSLHGYNWRTERVFLCQADGDAWLRPQLYNYETCEWRFWSVPCNGELVALLKDYPGRKAGA